LKFYCQLFHMRSFLQRSFLLFLATWLLLSSIGVAWTQSTCLFTGIQKESWSVRKLIDQKKTTQLKRSTCFHFKHFQIKNQSAFAAKKHAIPMGNCPSNSESFAKPIRFSNSRSVFIANSDQIPIAQTIRRAYLQIYQI
jgi:hypothetical protein